MPKVQLSGSVVGSAPAATAEDMRAIGRQIGSQLSPGTVVVLTGPLGAGKTTITQGIAEGLEVKGRVQSPTFTIVRTHKAGPRGIRLLHMDAYRLLGEGVSETNAPGELLSREDVLDTLESLDIDADLADAVLIAEWGRGVVETLAERVLDVEIRRATGGEASGDAVVDAGAAGGPGALEAGEGIDMSGEEEEDPREVTWRWL